MELGAPSACLRGWTVHYGVCNNGFVAFTGQFGSNPSENVYFTDAPTYNPDAPLGGSGLYMNAVGDVLVDDGYTDEWYLYINTTPTPEPATIFLLATGILALTVILRGRSAHRLA
jgi:hypothetical protein